MTIKSLKRSPTLAVMPARTTRMAPRPARKTTSYSCVGWRTISVAEIDPPWQPRRNSVGLIFEAGKKAANPSDRDAEHERQGEEVAGCDVDAPQTLDRFNGNQSADQPANDRLPAEQKPRL